MLKSQVNSPIDHTIIGRKVIEQEASALTALAQVVGGEFNDAVELIYNQATRLVVCGIGKSGHIAKKIAATLSSTGTPSIFVHATEASHGDLGMVTDKDVVLLLSNSGESTELNGIIEYCKRFAIPVIGITSEAASTLGKASTINLILPKVVEASAIDAPTSSTTMMLALGDALAVALHEMRGFTKADYRVFHPAGKIGAKLITVAEIMHTGESVPLVHEEASMLDAVLEISRKRLGHVGVISTEFELIGIFSDGDLRRHINSDMKNTKITDVMTSAPITINDSNILALEALGIMNRKAITALFVLEDKKPIGIVHMHDILKFKIA